MAWILNVVMTLLLIFIREPIAMIYDFDAETTELLLSSMFVFAVAITPKMLTYVIICGIIRAGGEPFYCMVVEAGLNLLLQVPLAYISVPVSYTHLELRAGGINPNTIRLSIGTEHIDDIIDDLAHGFDAI